MKKLKELLGKRIKELRVAQGITQQRLAELANIDQRSLSHIECGDNFPSKNLLEIAKALNVELPSLFDFNHINVDETYMLEYIKTNIQYLPKEYVTVIYRMLKVLR